MSELSLTSSWDLNYATYFLKRVIKLLAEDTTAMTGLNNLKTLSENFSERATFDSQDSSTLAHTDKEEQTLEEHWALLLHIVHCRQLPGCLQSSSKRIVELMVKLFP